MARELKSEQQHSILFIATFYLISLHYSYVRSQKLIINNPFVT